MGAQSLPALVHRRWHGRDGVYRGRVEHERSCVGVPAVPRCHRRGRGRVRYGTVEKPKQRESKECTSIHKLVARVSELRVRFNLERRATPTFFVWTDLIQDISIGEA